MTSPATLPGSSLRRFLVLTMAAFVLSACAGADSAADEAQGTAAPSPTAAADAEQFTGTIGGDAQLEGGCLWLDGGDERYELQLPADYDADRQELTITGPDGTTFAVGDDVTVTGTIVEDMVTVCQVGPVLDVADISAAG